MVRWLLLALALAASAPAQAEQKTPGQITTEITTLFPNNIVGAITPGSLRTVTKDIVDSFVPLSNIVAACTSNQWVQQIAAGGIPTCAQPSFSNISGSIAGNQLPFPTLSSLGGVAAINAVSSRFLTGLNGSGVFSAAQPTFTDISGQVLSSQMPAPGASALGGVKSSSASTNQFATGIDTSGAVTYAQPAFSNLSGTASGAQLPVPGASSLGGIKSSSAPTNQFATGVDTSGAVTYARPSFSNVSGTVAVSQLPGVITRNPQTGTTYTLQQADCGNSVEISNASPITVTLPSALTTQCAVLVMQAGAGNISFTQATGGTSPANAHGYTKTFGQYSAVTVINGFGGTASAWVLLGDAQ